MPADDLVLNVRQVAGYPPAGAALPSDTLLLQRGGLGGPYVSGLAAEFVATALSSGPSPAMQVGVAAPANATGSQVFTRSIAGTWDGWHGWNIYSNGTNLAYLSNGPGALSLADPALGWVFEWAAGGAAGAPATFTTAFTVTPGGYGTLADQLLLGRDPTSPMEAATANYVNGLRALSVTSFNMRFGDIMLNRDDIVCAGGAPAWSPWLQGSPRAPTPPPWSNSTRIATTEFVIKALQGGEAFDSPNLTGVPTAPTAPVGTNTDQIATTAFVQAAQFAPLLSPNFSGYPSAPTADPGTATGQLATTAFVQDAIIESTTGVASFNTRTGAVLLTTADISGAGGAILASPAFTGIPLAPTATGGTSNTQIATTAFVNAAIAAADYAPLLSPALTGVPTAPTAAPGTSTTQLATTAFVAAAVLGGSGVTSFMSRTGAITLTANDISAAGGASLNSPAFFGTPSAPTAAPSANTTQLATCAFVQAAIGAGGGVQSFNGRAGAVTLTAADVSAAGGPYMPTLGGTFTGPITVPSTTSATTAGLIVNGAIASNRAIMGMSNALPRWRINLADASAEGGANAGSNFAISRYDDTGVLLGAPITIARATGAVQIQGSSTNDNAAPGSVGEVISTINAVGPSFSSATVQNLALIALTPGDWDIFGEWTWASSAAGTITGMQAAISPTTNSIPNPTAMNTSRTILQFSPLGLTTSMHIAACRASVAVTTNYYLSGMVNFSSGTVTATGKIWARRAR